MGDEVVKTQLRKLNYRLCRRLLHRRFAKFPLPARFHWVGVFQGTRDAGTRHLHVLIHIPASVPMDTPFQCMKVKTAIQTAWLRAGFRIDQIFPWARHIDSSADSRAVATYVSRELTPTLWELEELCFSQ